MVSLRSISSSSRRSSKSSGDNCGLGNVALARLLMTDGSLAEQAGEFCRVIIMVV
jgi:hypothetical protein